MRRRKSEPAPTSYRIVFIATYVQEDGRHMGYVEELLGLDAVDGSTLDEVRERLREAAQHFVNVNRDAIVRRIRSGLTPGVRETFMVDVEA